MFPDALHFQNNVPSAGKVFGFELGSTGGMGASRTDRTLTTNIAEWDDCLQCPEFEHCYKLCMAKMSLESVIVAE